MIGWKDDPTIPRSKERGSANISLKDVLGELNEKDGDELLEDEEVQYGVINEDDLEDGSNNRS